MLQAEPKRYTSARRPTQRRERAPANMLPWHARKWQRPPEASLRGRVHHTLTLCSIGRPAGRVTIPLIRYPF